MHELEKDIHHEPHGHHELMEVASTDRRSFFDALRPKAAYWLGVLSGLAVVFAVGFFVMLGVTMKRGTLNTTPTPTPPAVAQNNTPPTPPAEIIIDPVSDKDHVKGNRNAKVSLIEFSDTECPFSKRFHPTVEQILTTYGDKINWVYRPFPLDSLHQYARKEAEALECAGELGGNDAYWKYLDKIFEITPSNDGLDPKQLPQIAKMVGLNQTKFETCLNSGKHANKIQESINKAVQAGGEGTPYAVVLSGNTKIPIKGALPFAQIKPLLDSLTK